MSLAGYIDLLQLAALTAAACILILNATVDIFAKRESVASRDILGEAVYTTPWVHDGLFANNLRKFAKYSTGAMALVYVAAIGVVGASVFALQSIPHCGEAPDRTVVNLKQSHGTGVHVASVRKPGEPLNFAPPQNENAEDKKPQDCWRYMNVQKSTFMLSGDNSYVYYPRNLQVYFVGMICITLACLWILSFCVVHLRSKLPLGQQVPANRLTASEESTGQ